MKKAKPFINAACGVLAAIMVVAGLISMLANFYIMNTARYEKYILTADYYETVLTARDDALDSFGSVIEIDSKELKTFFTDDMCKNLAAEYVRAVFYDMKNNAKTANSVVAESDGLKAYLADAFAEYDFSETEYKTTEAAVDSAYTLICDKVNSAVRFMPDKVMSALTKTVAPFWALVDGVVKYWLLFFAAAILLYIAMFHTSGARRVSTRLFGAASSFWCANVLVFLPVAVVFAGTSGVSLDLDKNALLYFLDGFINSLRQGVFYTTLVFAVASTAALITAGCFSTRPDKRIEDNGPLLMRE